MDQPDDSATQATSASGRATGGQPVGTPKPSTSDQFSMDIGICTLVAIAETMLVIAGVSGHIPLPVLLLIHCAIMLGVTLVLDQRERHRMDSRVLAVAVVTTAVSGPIGAAMTALLGVYLRLRKIETALLANWYERISGHARADAVVELHERIQAGRTLNPYVDARVRFAAILRSGPLEEKQRVLSVITQKYHPRFAGLLELALRNQDPPIRVQAAAVMARLKEQERNAVKALLAASETTTEAGADIARSLGLTAKLSISIDSGLLDEQDATQAVARAKTILRAILSEDSTHAGAAMQLAGLLRHEGDHAGAVALLDPLAARGIGDADQPLRASLMHLRRYAAASLLPSPALPRTRDVAAPVAAPRSTESLPPHKAGEAA